MSRKLIFIGIILCVFTILPSQARALDKGITVSPSIAHLDLSEDQPFYQLTYTNNTNSDLTLSLSVEDFSSLEDSYKLSFLSPKDAKNYKYSLSSWISFENKTIQLSPKETKSVTVFIDKGRITKGGHYASILAEIKQSETNKKVNIKAVISSLLFVRASTGQEIEEGKIASLAPLRDLFEYPDSYVFRFENAGNVHVVPYGLIEVFDPLGNLIAKGPLNENSLDALPESIRTYDTPVTTYEKVLIPGIYSAKISVHFGKTNQKISQSIKFFSQGSFDFVKVAAVIAILIIIGLYYKKRRK